MWTFKWSPLIFIISWLGVGWFAWWGGGGKSGSSDRGSNDGGGGSDGGGDNIDDGGGGDGDGSCLENPADIPIFGGI